MRSLLAFWLGGAAGEPFLPPSPVYAIFRLDEPAAASAIFRQPLFDATAGKFDEASGNFDSGGQPVLANGSSIFRQPLFDQAPGNFDDTPGSFDVGGSGGRSRMFKS